jgi:predicted alpha-1,6-mannanase (GH76 family)
MLDSLRSSSIAAACAVIGSLLAIQPSGAQSVPDVERFLGWGLNVAREIDSTLQLPGQSLYAETAHLDGRQSGGWNGKAFAWPHSAQFRSLNSLARYYPNRYRPALRSFADEFQAAFWSQSGGGYYCCHGGGDRFYDDNAHLIVALVEAYDITKDSVYLDRARSTFDFLLTGEAPGAGGGSYWSVQDHSFLDTTAALQGARAALMLYQATDDPSYLADAQRRYAWAKDVTQLPGGTFMEKLYLSGPKAGQIGDFDLVHYAGYAIAANSLFYDVTGDASYLAEAQRIATASLSRYFDRSTGRINDEGFWAYELVDGLVELYRRDGNSLWLARVATALQWLRDNKQDPAGHYGKFWGREGRQIGLLASWDLNDQAPVARAYLHTALVQVAPIVDGDFTANGVIDGGDLAAWKGAFGVANLADGDGNGHTDGADFLAWQRTLSSAVPLAVTAVPEPAAAQLAIIAILWTMRRCRIWR